ncbi:glycosyltransferase family 2 protein [Enterococcus asini]|uniref:Glycosyltransferase family 2 protein n=1 Tax=Enterococcus asini TaxID=57732 RepID=A0AAW8U0C9_9ENTE|nr:glycosyltransferase family 2 protein [Enterococcus asini]MCD5028421.1 glycosyltransferase family 2 protein [Enterococcus asini]MDT2762708.1 glycosyltransferase family 2 protein [Enterococcus asini]MDT2809395.1 glycosyltransferase family 2 protein [Enterococcus asini]
MKVLLIIPAYNEEAAIKSTVGEIDAFKVKQEYQLDYVVINDGSRDNTQEILQNNTINHVELILNLGIGGAVQTGYKYALENDYDIAVQFDGDGQHDIASLNNIIQPLLADEADLVIGSRFVPGSESEFQTSTMRRLGVRVISFFIKLVTGKKIYDTTSGYRGANRRVIEFFAERYPVKYPEPESIVHLLKKKFKVTETGVNMFERQTGSSSITPIKSVRYMTEVCLSIIIASLMKEND